MAITKFNVVEGLTVGDLVQIPVIDNTANVSANNLTVQGNSNLGNYATANYFVGNGSQLTGITLSNTLADVQITSPTLGQTLAYNGLVWVNTNTGAVSAGQGVDFFFTGPQIIAQTANNFFQLDTLSSSPNSTSSTVSQAINNTTAIITGGKSTALNRTQIDGGNWDFSVWANVDSISGTQSISPAIYIIEAPTCTFTVTGTGTSRTVTGSSGTPFANITASATLTAASFIQTPTGVYQLSAKTSNTVATIQVPTVYTNESTVTGYVWNQYFILPGSTITSSSMFEYLFNTNQVTRSISTTDRIGYLLFGTTSGARTFYVPLGGTTQSTYISTPLATLHDELAGLQGGQASEYFHLTANEYAGTGTGNFVRQSNANLINPNIDSAIGISLNLTGNLISGNANLGNLATANFITGALTTGSQPNITSLGNLSSLTSNGTIDFTNATNVSLGNVSNLKILGGVAGYVLKTDGAGNLSWGIDTTAAGGTNTQVQFNDNNVLGGNAKFTFDKSTGLVTVTGNINALNADLGNLVAANYISANGYLLTNINGSNVTGTVANANYATYAGTAYSVDGGNVNGQVANALIAGTVYTNAQPNITSVGTLSSLSVTGNISSSGSLSVVDAIVAGNLTVSGNTIYANVTTLNVKDPVIEMGGNPNGDPLTTNDGKDRGTLLHYYSGAALDAFMGWDNSNSEFAFGSNVSITNDIVTFNQFGNVRANYFLGNASQLTGTIANANFASFAGTVTTNSQPNITSLGTLSTLTVTGNISSGNANLGNLATANFFSGNGYFLSDINVSNIGTVANANYAAFAGNVTLAAQPNITSLGTLSSLSVTGNISSGNANLGNLVIANYFTGNGSLLSSITGSNVTGQVANALVAGTVYTNSQPNITSVGTLNGLIANATIDFTNATNVSLGNVSNLKILGGSSGYVLKTDGTGNLSWGIDTTAAAGSNTQIQFNDGNALGADSNLIYNKATQVLDVLGTVAGYVIRPSIGSGANGIVFPNNPGGGTGDGASIKYYAYSGEDSVLEFTIANDANDYVKFNSPGGVVIDNNITANNANLGNLVTANYFNGNGSLLTSLTGGNVTGQVANALIAGTVYTNAQPNITSLGTLASLNVTGNITTGNATLGNLTISNYFSGNGSLLSSITGANVTGTVPNANYSVFAGTVIAQAQPNITSVGNLSGLTVNGNATVAGNLTVSGTTIYANVTTFNVKDPIIELGGTGNNDPLSSNDGKDRGMLLHYYTTAPVDAFMGWDNGNSEFAFGSNVTVTNELVTYNQFGNVRANYFLGNGSQLTGTIANANYASFAGTVTTNAQPNITSVGTLNNLSVTSNITVGNISATGSIIGAAVTANYSMVTTQTTGKFYPTFVSGNTSGNYTLNSNSTFAFDIANSELQVGNLVSGTGTGGSITGANLISANFFTGTLTTAAQPNVTSLGTLSSLTVTANVSAGNVLTNNLLYANGVAWSFGSTYSNANVAAYLPTYTGNVSANYFIGNGSTLTNITGANVTGQVGNSLIAGTVYTNAQPNITSLGTLTGLTVSGNASFTGANTYFANVANIKIPGGSNGYVLKTDGAGNLSWGIDTTDYSNTNVAAYLPTYTGLIGGTLTTASQPNVTSLGTLASLNVTGNITAGNASLGNLVSANFVSGNGSLLSSITGGNVTGQVGNALIAGTVYTNAQPNITSLGTLASLNVTGNVTVGNSNLGNLAVANFFSGNGSLLTSITAGNINGQVANALVAGTVYTNSQPNITSVGTLSSLTVTGLITATGTGIKTSNIQDSLGTVTITTGYNSVSGDVGVYGNLVVGTSGTGNVTAYNASLGNLVTASYFSGNGALLSSITGANVTGQVGNALIAGTVYTNSQPNITSLGTLSNLSVTANISAGNITATGTIIGAAVTANYVMTTLQTTGTFYPTFVSNSASGNYALAANANISFDVANSTLNVPKILSGTGNGGSITGANLISANYFQGDGSLLTNLNIGNASVSNANYASFAGNVINSAQPNITSLGNLSSLTVTGNISAGNLLTDNLLYANGVAWSFGSTYSNTNVAAYLPTYTGNVSANYFIGNGSTLTDLTGSNVTGQVGNALISGTVYTNAQPNITSVGTLSNLSVSGNATIAGDLTVTGNTVYANVTTLNVKDPIIELGGTGNSNPLTSNDGKDRGTLLHYYTTAPVDAFMGWDNSNAEFGFGSNVTVTNEVVTWNTYGNIRANYIYGNGAFLTGLPAGYSNTNVAAYLPTYTGNLTAGNITGANLISGNFLTGTLTTNAQPNITSLGTLASLSATGNVSGGNLISNSLGNQQIAISLNGLLVGGPDLLWEFSNAALYAKNIKANGVTILNGNITSLNADLGNLATANYFTGNGSLLTAINGSNVTGQVANALLSGTVYTNAQPNITSLGTLSSLSVTSNVTAGNIKSDNLLYANGTPYVFTTNAAGSNTQVQFNDGNLFAGSSAFTFNKSSNTLNVTNFTVSNITTSDVANLGDVSNVKIFGGSTGYLLATDGFGNLSWLNSSGGGGSGFVNIVKNSFTGNGVQTTFNLNTTPSSEESVMVNIDGLLQQDSVYSISGAQLIFATAPLSGVKIEVTIFGAVPITTLNTQVLFANGSNVVGSGNFTFNNTTNTLSVTNVTSSSNVSAGNIKSDNLLYANGTPYVFTTNAAGSNTQVQFNDGNSFAGSANFTFDKTTNTLSVTNIIGNGAGITYITGSNVNGQVGNALIAGTVYTNSQPNITSVGTLSSLNVTGNLVAGNLEATNGTVKLGSGLISVSGSNAGILTTGISNINLGLAGNVILGSTTGNVVVQGRIGANLFYSNRAAIVVTTNTVIDSFTITEYRSAKYTMRVNSDDGYQTAEVLLIHDGSNSYVTIYGTLSTIGTDIISLSSDINSGNVRLLATTGSANTTVKVLGTYVAD